MGAADPRAVTAHLRALTAAVEGTGIHSLAVLGGGLAVAIGAWIAWIALERGRLVPVVR